jgi:hypothetical protein
MPVVYLDEMGECPLCGEEEAYVEHGGDKMCKNCQYAPRASAEQRDEKDEWAQWQEHRGEEYSGFTGPDRIKMVGGFVAPYVE